MSKKVWDVKGKKNKDRYAHKQMYDINDLYQYIREIIIKNANLNFLHLTFYPQNFFSFQVINFD